MCNFLDSFYVWKGNSKGKPMQLARYRGIKRVHSEICRISKQISPLIEKRTSFLSNFLESESAQLAFDLSLERHPNAAIWIPINVADAARAYQLSSHRFTSNLFFQLWSSKHSLKYVFYQPSSTHLSPPFFSALSAPSKPKHEAKTNFHNSIYLAPVVWAQVLLG